MKPYRTRDGRTLYALAPWEGSAFQALGLGLCARRSCDRPSWRTLLENVVDIEVDYATRQGLPGFLSESYTGDGTQYTGSVGIPEITVSPRPRITDAASLYTLGVAYSIAPGEGRAVPGGELARRSRGCSPTTAPGKATTSTRREAIRVPDHRAHPVADPRPARDGVGPHEALPRIEGASPAASTEFFRPGEAVDLLGRRDPGLRLGRQGRARSGRGARRGAFRVQGDRVDLLGIAFVAEPQGGREPLGRPSQPPLPLRRSRSSRSSSRSSRRESPADAGLIPKEIFTRFADTGGREAEIEFPLPATPGLSQIKEVVITHEPAADGRPIDLSVTRLEFQAAGIDDVR